MKSIREPKIQIDCTDLVQSHGPHQPRCVCIHDTESHDVKGLSDIWGIAQFWNRQGLGYGSQIIVDKDGNTGRCVADRQVAWHVGGHNTNTLGIEQIGFARFGKPLWLARPAQLEKVARWLAYWHDEYGIPLRRATYNQSTGLMTDGVFTHKDWSDVSPKSDHWDPGFGYPFFYVLYRARQLVKQGGWR